MFYGAITVAVLVAFLGANDFGAIFGVLAQADYKYVLFALVLTLVYFALTPLSTWSMQSVVPSTFSTA